MKKVLRFRRKRIKAVVQWTWAFFVMQIGCESGKTSEVDNETGRSPMTSEVGPTATGQLPSPTEPRCPEKVGFSAGKTCEQLGVVLDPAWRDRYSCEVVAQTTDVVFDPVNVSSGVVRDLLTSTHNPDILWVGAGEVTDELGSGAGGVHQVQLARSSDCRIHGLVSNTAERQFDAPQINGPMGFLEDGTFYYEHLAQRLTLRSAMSSQLKPAVFGTTYDYLARQLIYFDFVPAGAPGSGKLKAIVQWTVGNDWDWVWGDVPYTRHSSVDLTLDAFEPRIRVQGPRPGSPDDPLSRRYPNAYVDTGSPGFPHPGLLAGTNAGQLFTMTLYDVDSEGDPVLDSGRVFFTAFNSETALGGSVDSWSGDFLFVLGQNIVAFHGFTPSRLL